MTPTERLREAGQSIWLDSISRELLDAGTIARYADELAVTGLTSNPTIFDRAIAQSGAYDEAIRTRATSGRAGEAVFFELALEDLSRAAALFAPAHRATGGADGWVSLEVSPLLAHDVASTLREATELHARAGLPNLLIKIPGTEEGVTAVEECIAAGIPVNVTLLFSAEHYLRAAEAYVRGIERRVAAGLDPAVGSVASVFVSRWDKAVLDTSPVELRDRLGIAIAKRTYRAYRELLVSERWRRLEREGARAQRLLFASTGTKDPEASDVLYVTSLVAPDTINTMPEETLLAFAEHGEVGPPLPEDGGDSEEVLAAFATAGVDVGALAERLQGEGAQAFDASWNDLLACIAGKATALAAGAGAGNGR